MNYTSTFRLCAALCAVLGMACLASAPAMAGERDMGCSPTLASPCPGGGGGGGYTTPVRDYEAERRQREAAAAEAAAEAERQRQAEERRLKEEAERQAAFIRARDAAANTLKGSSGIFVSPNDGGLKGGNDFGLKGSSNYGLKDAVSDHGLKGIDTSTTGVKSAGSAAPRSSKTKKPAAQACDRCERFSGTDACWTCCGCQQQNNLRGCNSKSGDAYLACANDAATAGGNCNLKCSSSPPKKN